MSSMLRDFTRINAPVHTGCKIVENVEKECRVAMFHASMGLSRLMFHVNQVEESRKRKYIRAGKHTRKAEKNFQRHSSIEIRDKTKFKKGLFHKG